MKMSCCRLHAREIHLISISFSVYRDLFSPVSLIIGTISSIYFYYPSRQFSYYPPLVVAWKMCRSLVLPSSICCFAENHLQTVIPPPPKPAICKSSADPVRYHSSSSLDSKRISATADYPSAAHLIQYHVEQRRHQVIRSFQLGEFTAVVIIRV